MFRIVFNPNWERDMREESSVEDLVAKENELQDKFQDIMRALAENIYSWVKFYPYQTAEVTDVVFEAVLEEMKPFEYILALKAGARPGNHTTYEVYYGCGDKKVFVHCSDNIMRVGRKIIKHTR